MFAPLLKVKRYGKSCSPMKTRMKIMASTMVLLCAKFHANWITLCPCPPLGATQDFEPFFGADRVKRQRSLSLGKFNASTSKKLSITLYINWLPPQEKALSYKGSLVIQKFH